MLKRPSAFLPLAMSCGAFAAVLVFLAVHGPDRQPGEGSAAHVWQLLMAGQIPIVLSFAIKWVPRSTAGSAHTSVSRRGGDGAGVLPSLVEVVSLVEGQCVWP